jgi:hypothetical protein
MQLVKIVRAPFRPKPPQRRCILCGSDREVRTCDLCVRDLCEWCYEEDADRRD